jgi:3-phenylpropionate/trans-cinnamate dioxygenase ferredoxin reductase subunit
MNGQMVIVGAGQAGCQAAVSVRAAGYKGRVVLIGEEPALPYQRPPLSKAFLQGELAEERLFLRPFAFYEQQSIELRLGARAEAIERADQRIVLTSGERIAYDRLFIGAGAPPRRLDCPGTELPGVHYLRTLADSRALGRKLAPMRRLAVVGAGYIGLEVAASARKAGLDVVVIEAAARVLARVAGPYLSSYIERRHREAGVDIRLGAGVAGFEGQGRVEAVRLLSGERFACDLALIGVGATPSTALAAAAGLEIANGVVVDEYAATSDPAIYAGGDCANFPSPLYGRRMRLESVPNAIDQAKVAGSNMAGGRLIHDGAPWFWSDQYDIKLQMAGLSEGADRTVIRGEAATGRFSAWSLQGARLLAVDAVNDPAAFAIAKRLIAAKGEVDAKTLADPDADLKSLLP